MGCIRRGQLEEVLVCLQRTLERVACLPPSALRAAATCLRQPSLRQPRSWHPARALAVQAYQPDLQMQDPAVTSRKFANFTVYKGKGAMCLKV